MNRAQNIKSYLNDRLEMLNRLRESGDSKKNFFPAIKRFRETTVSYLRHTKIIDHNRLQELDRLLAEIDSFKTKGVGDQVYWSRVDPALNKVRLLLDEFIRTVDEINIPFRLLVKDYLSDRAFLQVIAVGIIVTLVSALIIYLISCLF